MSLFVSKNLKIIMDEKNLNKTKLSKLCDISVYKITKWLSGESLPRANDLYKICKCLNISAEWLVRNKLTK